MLADIPVRLYTGGVIGISGTLNNDTTRLNFILDSGSSGISVDSATVHDLGLIPHRSDTTVAGIAGRKKVSYIFNQKLHLAELCTDSLNFYISDYTDISAIYGQKIDGVIGYAFLRRYIIHVDFDTLRMQVYSPGKYKYGSSGQVLRPVFNFLPIQMVSVNDSRKISFPFYMDSGAGLCVLMSEQFTRDSSIILPKRKPVITQTEGVGGKKEMQLTVVKSLHVGPYIFHNVPAYIYNDEQNITAYPFTGGLLGNDIMRRFNITYNYPQREIHINPNRHFYEEFDYAYTGITLYDINDGIFAEDIIPGSPAATAGLRSHDEIIGIDKNFSGKIGQYTDMLQKAKQKVEIIIRRNGQLQTLTIIPLSILH